MDASTADPNRHHSTVFLEWRDPLVQVCPPVIQLTYHLEQQLEPQEPQDSQRSHITTTKTEILVNPLTVRDLTANTLIKAWLTSTVIMGRFRSLQTSFAILRVLLNLRNTVSTLECAGIALSLDPHLEMPHASIIIVADVPLKSTTPATAVTLALTNSIDTAFLMKRVDGRARKAGLLQVLQE